MFLLLIFKIVIIFVLGLIFGSFANVVVDREGGQKGGEGENKKNNEKKNKKRDKKSREGESFWRGRSKCDYCQQKIVWYDNIPLISYILLRGKCRHCQKKISWQYPAVELLFAFGFLLASWQAGGLTGFLTTENLITTIFYLAISFILLTILVWDLKFMIIPDGLVVGGLVLAVIYFGYQYIISPDYLMSVQTDLTRNFLGGVIVGGFFLAMFQFSRGRWIGGGDVKLGFLLGFLVGWQSSYLLLLLAYILGAIPAIYLLITGKVTAKTKIPFGPFLVIAELIVLFWGKEILVLWGKIV